MNKIWIWKRFDNLICPICSKELKYSEKNNICKFYCECGYFEIIEKRLIRLERRKNERINFKDSDTP